MEMVSCWGMSLSVGANPREGFFVKARCLLGKALVQSLGFSLHIGPVSIHTVDFSKFVFQKNSGQGEEKKPKAVRKAFGQHFVCN